ncbi:hypothetical protein LG288_11085 [Idiomarina seosinensis]|uniref:hypothetical protein n=1 Tax=Idiomarina seosinensis TaxID=281739 RepID=UPI00384CC97B
MPKNLKIVALAMCLVGFSSSTMAETATDTIDVYAGLAPALELSCTDVHFGVWRVPTGDRGSVTTVTLTAGAFSNGAFATTESASGGGDRVSLSQSSDFNESQVGTCSVTGSTAAENATGSASLLNEDTGQVFGSLVAITSSGDYSFGTIGTPLNTEASMFYTLELSDRAPTIDANGEARFAVVGEFTIPQTIDADWYGGYKSNGSETVQFDDAPQ